MIRPAWSRHVPVLVVAMALPLGVAIPAVDSTRQWFGVPALILWSLVGVAALTPALVIAEFVGRSPDRPEHDEEVPR